MRERENERGIGGERKREIERDTEASILSCLYGVLPYIKFIYQDRKDKIIAC